MSMTGAGMSAAIKSAIVGQYGSPTDDPVLQKFCDALGNAIVTYVQGNATVNVASVSGVTSGGDSSGPGSGTIS